eukprot:449373-Prymnesium_polylepis.1
MLSTLTNGRLNCFERGILARYEEVQQPGGLVRVMPSAKRCMISCGAIVACEQARVRRGGCAGSAGRVARNQGG